jgi:hypothetical protein
MGIRKILLLCDFISVIFAVLDLIYKNEVCFYFMIIFLFVSISVQYDILKGNCYIKKELLGITIRHLIFLCIIGLIGGYFIKSFWHGFFIIICFYDCIDNFKTAYRFGWL